MLFYLPLLFILWNKQRNILIMIFVQIIIKILLRFGGILDVVINVFGWYIVKKQSSTNHIITYIY